MAASLPSDVSPEAMLGQAQHIWTMLDEMAASNPEAYQKFIKKQLKEGQEVMKPPKPHMCVQTMIHDTGKENAPLFINVFEWNRIPDAKDDESPIPVMGGQLYCGKDEDGLYKAVCVAFHPNILQRFGLHSNLEEERQMLINLAIDYLEDQHKKKISRNFSVLGKDLLCKGPEKTAIKSLMEKSAKKDEEFQQQLSDLEKAFGPAAQGCKDSLLSKISSIAVGESDQSESLEDRMTGSNQPEIRMPGQTSQPNKVLVQELSEGNDSMLPEPVYDVITKEINGQEVFVIKIHLPGVKSVKQCELDISEDDVELTVTDQYHLQLTLSHKIDHMSASAKFNRKSSVLTLSLPYLNKDG